MQQTHDDQRQPPRRHWFGFVAAPAAWCTYFVFVYSLSELTCRLGFFSGTIAGVSTSVFVTLLFALLTLAVIAVGAVYARRAQQIAKSADIEPALAQRYRFGGDSGLVMSVAFALGTIVLASLALLLPVC